MRISNSSLLWIGQLVFFLIFPNFYPANGFGAQGRSRSQAPIVSHGIPGELNTTPQPQFLCKPRNEGYLPCLVKFLKFADTEVRITAYIIKEVVRGINTKRFENLYGSEHANSLERLQKMRPQQREEDTVALLLNDLRSIISKLKEAAFKTLQIKTQTLFTETGCYWSVKQQFINSLQANPNNSLNLIKIMQYNQAGSQHEPRGIVFTVRHNQASPSIRYLCDETSGDKLTQYYKYLRETDPFASPDSGDYDKWQFHLSHGVNVSLTYPPFDASRTKPSSSTSVNNQSTEPKPIVCIDPSKLVEEVFNNHKEEIIEKLGLISKKWTVEIDQYQGRDFNHRNRKQKVRFGRLESESASRMEILRKFNNKIFKKTVELDLLAEDREKLEAARILVTGAQATLFLNIEGSSQPSSPRNREKIPRSKFFVKGYAGGESHVEPGVVLKVEVESIQAKRQ